MATRPQRILVVDDEADLRELLSITLGRMNLESVEAASLEDAHHALSNTAFDLCLTDMNLGDGDGIELVRHISRHYPDLPVAMITAYGNMETAIDAMKEGAFDFIAKPVALDRLKQLIIDGLNIKSQPQKTISQEAIIGESAAINNLRHVASRLARSQAPVYISGESGSGKERVARLIHNEGPRKNKPFIAVNCGAIPSELMESEFFGHRKGSFTGANEDRKGLFREADEGTLFLDEVADLPLHMQVKLLRAIQEKSVRPIGEPKEFPVNIRILSATHKNLQEEIQKQSFRQDLYYRLNVIEVRVPPLRERASDIPLLVQFILENLCRQWNIPTAKLSPTALKSLMDYHFPGNVRELENILERALTMFEGKQIDSQHLQLPSGDNFSHGNQIHSRPQQQPLEDYLQEIERTEILTALEATHWNRTAAAKKLGMTFRSLRYRLQKLSLDQGDDDEEGSE